VARSLMLEEERTKKDKPLVFSVTTIANSNNGRLSILIKLKDLKLKD
jgi:hypothetical protein